METNTAISALIPVKNGEIYIKKFWSTFQQNLRASEEVIFVNDNSTDNTLDLLLNLSKQDSKIKVISNYGYGLVDALNLGIKEAVNPWIARFDIDDVCVGNRLSIQKKYIQEKTVAIFTDYEFRSQSQKSLGIIPSAIFSSGVKMSLYSSQRTPHPSVLFNKDAVINVGGYAKEDFPAEDLSLWLKLSRQGDMTSVPQILLEYQLNANSVSANNREAIKKKKHQLLQSIGLSVSDIQQAELDFNDMYLNYQNYSYSNLRKILLIKDLIAMNKYNFKNKNSVVKLLKNSKEILTPKNSKSFFLLSTDLIKRKNYRNRDFYK